MYSNVTMIWVNVFSEWAVAGLAIVYERYVCIFCKCWLTAISLDKVASTDWLMIGIVCRWYALFKVRIIAICYIMKCFNNYTQWWKNSVCPNACLIRQIPICDLIVKTCTMLSHHTHVYSVSKSIGYMYTCSILGTRMIWLSFSIHNFRWNMILRLYSNLNGGLSILSHTWVRYPGFSGHGVKCPILTTVVQGFSGDLIGCTIRSKWGPFGDLCLARKIFFCVWNKLFLGEIKFSLRRTSPVESLWWQIVPVQESTNEWKNITIF